MQAREMSSSSAPFSGNSFQWTSALKPFMGSTRYKVVVSKLQPFTLLPLGALPHPRTTYIVNCLNELTLRNLNNIIF